MLFKKVPADIRWIFSVGMIFLITMAVWRGIFFISYNPPGKAFSGSAFFMGLRFDLKFAAIISVIIFLLSRISFINPFKNNSSKKFWNFFLPFLYMLLLVFYAADYYHYDYL
ncbi:MAG TPA: hypothetical protein VK498_01535, partial [Ferruginibacter sp.]|nr:hypothetical protein [Ferruginibacter sp.]